MSAVQQILGKNFSAVSLLNSKNVATIARVDNVFTYDIVFSSTYTASGTTGTVNFSGTVSIYGVGVSFNAFAQVYSTPQTMSTSITVNGINRTANRSTVGLTESTSFYLLPGTYAYSGTVTFSGGGGFAAGGIGYVQDPSV